MARSSTSRPWRSLGVLGLLILTIYGIVAAGVVWSDASWTPKLGLDLQGGVQIVLKPEIQPGMEGTITKDTLNEAVSIIRQRVDSTGVSEAEITTQGSGANSTIVVALPGDPDQRTRDLVKKSAQLQFRAVIASQPGGKTPEPTASPSPTTSGKPSPSPSTSPKASTSPAADDGAKATPSPTESANNATLPKAVRQALAPKAADPTPSPTTTPKAAATPDATAGATPSPAATKPTDGSDTAWATEDVIKDFAELDCTDPKNLEGGFTADPKKPMVACENNGQSKFILGPAELSGTDIKTASAGLGTNSQGNATGEWQVNLEFTGKGGDTFADVTTRLAAIDHNTDRNRFAIVLDGLVISAPGTNERIPTGQAQITGGFTQSSATNLASQVKFGALPLSFTVQTDEKISATLGEEQLHRGLLAGLIGLVLVVVYSLLQYRALGLVTVASLVVVGVITYGMILLLSWRQGYRLTLPGVAGLIVSIGVTADSFIVYFERIRDEVRDGKQLQPAVEAAWVRARRTILASDTVSFLAALVLFILAVGGVKGFAFTLGLTTLVDVGVVFLFTHPMMVLLSRTKFYGGGNKWSGFDAAHLGRDVSYAGRGRVRTPSAAGKETIAERRARAAQEATSGEPVQDDPPTPGESAPKDIPASSGGKR